MSFVIVFIIHWKLFPSVLKPLFKNETVLMTAQLFMWRWAYNNWRENGHAGRTHYMYSDFLKMALHQGSFGNSKSNMTCGFQQFYRSLCFLLSWTCSSIDWFWYYKNSACQQSIEETNKGNWMTCWFISLVWIFRIHYQVGFWYMYIQSSLLRDTTIPRQCFIHTTWNVWMESCGYTLWPRSRRVTRPSIKESEIWVLD